MDDDRFRPAISETQLGKLIKRGWSRVFNLQDIQPREILKRKTNDGFEYIIYPERLLLKPNGFAVKDVDPLTFPHMETTHTQHLPQR